MAIWRRDRDLDGLIPHSDAGSQFTTITNTERLAEAGIEPSVGSRGDSYDNALAESEIGLFKIELIRRRGAWRTPEQVELATLKWVDWFNNRRLPARSAMPAGGVRRELLRCGRWAETMAESL